MDTAFYVFLKHALKTQHAPSLSVTLVQFVTQER